MELLGMERRTDESIGKKIPLKDILSQHRLRYVLHAEIGDIVLKRITYLDMESTTLKLMSEVDGYAEAIKEASILEEKLKYGDLDAEDVVKLNNIGGFVKQHVKAYYLHCFAEPILDAPEEFDAILGALNASERHILLSALGELTNPNAGKVSINGLIVAQEAGIPAASDLTLENMTAQQSRIFVEKSEIQNKNLKELMK